MFLWYVLLFVTIVFAHTIWHVARAPYDELKEQHYSDELINRVKGYFKTDKKSK
jgi:hypothetical protein